MVVKLSTGMAVSGRKPRLAEIETALLVDWKRNTGAARNPAPDEKRPRNPVIH